MRERRGAVAAAEAYVGDTLTLLDEQRAMPDRAAVLDSLTKSLRTAGAAGDRLRDLQAARLDPQTYQHLMLVAATADGARRWQRHKVVYRLHPELQPALAESRTDQRIPCEVFNRLPHPDPFIAFADPIPMPEPAEYGYEVAEPLFYTGMLVTGIRRDYTRCSTDDDDLAYLAVALVGPVRYVGNAHSCHEERTLHLPASGQGTIADLVRRDPARARGSEPSPDDAELETFRLAISVLLYLCSSTADLRSQPQRRAKRTKGDSRRRARQRPTTVIDVGFDIGPALGTYRTGTTGDSDGTSEFVIGMRPHLRRAHWHTYWHGPRDAPTAQLHWIAPTAINTTGGLPRPVVVDADPPR